jgi:hypothetical protein
MTSFNIWNGATWAVIPIGMSTGTFRIHAYSLFPLESPDGAGEVAPIQASTNKEVYAPLDFDKDSVERAVLFDWMPNDYDGGTVTVVPVWIPRTGATAGDVVWSIRAVAIGNDVAIDTAYGTPQISTDTLLHTARIHEAPATPALTIAGTTAANKLVFWEVSRNATASGDTLDGDAGLLGLVVTYTRRWV